MMIWKESELQLLAGRCSIFLFALIFAQGAIAQHPAITLLDKNGEIINPITGENAHAPFSTEQTCGLCHDYETITRGYHFQMGWNVISDDYGVKEGKPWSISNGFLGRWYPYAFRQLARKNNNSPDEIDLTVYDFVGFSSPGRGQLPCGACHPGGGGLQYDREGNRYDDHLASNPELVNTPDGDYYKSRWHESGVVEADCLICHLEGYNFEERVDQLKRGNYRWAVVAGSRIGTVSGSVTSDQEPSVTYERRLFNEDGTITLSMSWPPPDDNCMYCHGESDVKKRGFSWNDVFNPDVHNQQGISCTACHPANLDHQISKGKEPVFAVAPEYDNTMKDCTGCHNLGYLGAPVPDHESVRPSHIDKIACESCHIPRLNRSAAQGFETTSGEFVFYIEPPAARTAGEIGEWLPDYERRKNGRVYCVNSVLAIWWGNRDRDGLIHPLFLREHKAAWDLFSDKVTDDNGDGRPEVNREDEIVAGLQAFSRSLDGNRRFERIQPVFIKAETAYELDETGRMKATPLTETALAGASMINFSINHNTAPTRMALGTNGCSDCHVSGAHFFMGQRIIDLYGPDGKAVTKSNGSFLDCRRFAFIVNSFHQQIISPYVGPILMIIVFLIVLHYHSYGPKRITFNPYSQEIQRFSLMERAIHLFRLISFVFLAVTGLIMAFNLHLWQQLLFGSAQRLLDFHIWSGVAFIVTTIGGVILWFRDALFASYDRDWVRKIGGYLGHKGEVPAGRFNAGQKMFYWYSAIFGIVMSVTGLMLIAKGAFSLPTVCLVSTIHNLIGFFLIAGVVAHAYLGTVANPGTWRVLVDGSVSREWARHHHPNWYRALIMRGEIGPEEPEASKHSDNQDSVRISAAESDTDKPKAPDGKD